MLGATNSEKHGKKGGCLHSQVTTADGENTETFPIVVVVPMCVTCLNRSNISFSRLFVFGVQQLRRNSWENTQLARSTRIIQPFSENSLRRCNALPVRRPPCAKMQSMAKGQRGKANESLESHSEFVQSSFMNSYGLYWFVVYCMEKIQGVCLRRRGHRNAKLYNMYCLFSS